MSYRAGEPRPATQLVDPVSHLQAQDEAVYAASSMRMAAQGDWLTPRFLGRYALYKPPLAYWLSAFSMKLGGIGYFALRAPSLIAAALTVTVLFAWLWRSQSLAAACAAALLLLGNRLFHTLARTATMDSLLLLWTVAAVVVLARDPALERRRSAWIIGALAGCAVMTKAVAGTVPLLILAVHWAIARRAERPPFVRLIEAGIAAAAVALPWHAYQFAAHRVWFWNEYILTEHLALGLSAPQTTDETHLWFYARRLFLTDPVLCLCAAVALARAHLVPRVTLAFAATAAVVLFGFQYRAAWYLLPLVAALAAITAIAAARSKTLPLLLLVLSGLKLFAPAEPYGLPYSAESELPGAGRLEQQCRAASGGALFLLNPADQFYSATLALPRVHYLYVDPSGQTNHGAMKFGDMGITVTGEQFRNLDQLRPQFRERMREWGLDSEEALATVILLRDAREADAWFALPPRSDSPAPTRGPVPGWCGSPR